MKNVTNCHFPAASRISGKKIYETVQKYRSIKNLRKYKIIPKIPQKLPKKAGMSSD